MDRSSERQPNEKLRCEKSGTQKTPAWAAKPVLYLQEGNLAPSRATRNDGNAIIRTLFVAKNGPGEHEGESRDAHPDCAV
jgi:hypothetical protein